MAVDLRWMKNFNEKKRVSVSSAELTHNEISKAGEDYIIFTLPKNIVVTHWGIVSLVAGVASGGAAQIDVIINRHKVFDNASLAAVTPTQMNTFLDTSEADQRWYSDEQDVIVQPVRNLTSARFIVFAQYIEYTVGIARHTDSNPRT